MLRLVILSKKAKKELATVPKHVALKLQDWVEDVDDRGIKDAVELVRVKGVDKHVYQEE